MAKVSIYLIREGKRYLDACAGVHVVSIGHGVKEIADVMGEQASQVCFTYSRFPDTSADRSRTKNRRHGTGGTLEIVFRFWRFRGDRVRHENGAKISYRNRQSQKVQSHFRGGKAWHGNTIGALSMSGRTSWRDDYVPYLLDFPHIPAPYCYRCPYGQEYPDCHLTCADELERVIHQEGSEYISAFIAEPILGTSAAGVVPPTGLLPHHSGDL